MQRATSPVPPFRPAPRPPGLPDPSAGREAAVERMTAGFEAAQESALMLYLLVALPAAVDSIREVAPPGHLAFAPLLALGLPQQVRVGLATAIYDGARRAVRDYLAACHLAGISLPGLADALAPGADAVDGPGAPGSPERDARLRAEAPWLFAGAADPVASRAALGFPVAGPTASPVGRPASGGQRPREGARFAVGPDGGVADLGAAAVPGSAAGSGPGDPA
mgnify:CR=1 FL=1